MKAAYLLLALLVITSCMKMHHKKREQKQGFREKLHGLKNLSDKQYKKWQEKLLRERTGRDTIPHSYEEIAETVNNLKTTWKAKAYKKDYTPFLGAILDGLEGLPEKTFKESNADLPDESGLSVLLKL